MTYKLITDLYEAKPNLFLPVQGDDWLDEWVHTWVDDFDDAFKKRGKSREKSDLGRQSSLNLEESIFDDFEAHKGQPNDVLPEWLKREGRAVKYWPNTPDIASPDAYGFHLPFHVSRDYHGIYLIEDACTSLARDFRNFDTDGLLEGYHENVANLFIYYHEAFHHKVEMFATRLEVIVRRKCFLGPVTELYQDMRDTADWREEALANVHAYHSTIGYMKQKAKIGPQQQAQLEKTLLWFLKLMPKGYREAAHYIENPRKYGAKAQKLKNEFWELIQQRYMPNTESFPQSLWTFTKLDVPHNTNKGRLNFLIRKDSPLLKRASLNGRFLSTREFVKRCNKLGEINLKRQGKGSHQIWVGPSGKPVSLPSHDSLKIGTLSKVLKDLGFEMTAHDFLRKNY